MMHPDRDGRIPLHHAASTNSIGEARARLEAGDDPNHADLQGFTPLHFAAQEFSVDVGKLLLEYGADVDRPNKYGNTALFTAVFNSRGRGEFIMLLRERGADPYHANASGQTPVGLARLIANYDVARFFEDLPGCQAVVGSAG